MAFDKIYTRINWINQPGTSTALGSTNLNKMDVALNTLDDRTVTLDTTKFPVTDALTMVANWDMNLTTGVITVTLKNGTIKTFDTALEKVPVSGYIDTDTNKLIFTNTDGTTTEVDISKLVTQYEFVDSSTIGFLIGSDGKVSCFVKDGSVTANKLEPNYLANITIQANIATAQAVIATTNADLSKRYAVGGVVPEDITDNSKYYRDQAKLYRDEAQGIVGVGIATDTVIGLVKGNGNVEVRSDGAMWANGYKDKATIADTSLAHFTTSDNGLAELFLNGKSNQLVTVEGIQKFDKAKATPVKYILPTTGAVTNSSYSNQASVLKEIPSGETAVTISGLTFVQPNVPVGLAWYNNLGVFISGVSYRTLTGNGTYTKPAGAVYIRFTVNVIDLATAQLEWGTVAHAYTGFVPNSPSTDYSAPIIPFNANGTAKARANRTQLLNLPNGTYTNSGVTAVVLDGVITVTGTATGNSLVQIPFVINLIGTYTLSANNNTATSNVNDLIRLQVADGTTIASTPLNVVNNKTTFTTSSIGIQALYVRTNSGNTVSYTIKPQLQIGATATPYEPYKSNEAPITFSGYDLPNEVKDTPDYTRLAIGVFDGSSDENWSKQTTGIAGRYRFTITIANKKIDGALNSLLCTMFEPISYSIGFSAPPTSPSISGHSSVNSINVYGTMFDGMTVEQFKTWLTTHIFTVLTELATPIPHTPSRTFVTTYATETNISIIDPVQTTFTAVAKSELWSRDYLQDVGIADTKNSTVTFPDTTTDAPLDSGLTHATLWSRTKKKFADIVTALAEIYNNFKYTLADTTNGLNKVYTTGALGIKTVSYSAGDIGAPSAYWGTCICKGSASANAQIAIDSTGAMFERMFVSGSPSWNRVLKNTDLVNTDTQNVTDKPLGANVGYTLGQEIDVIKNNLGAMYFSPALAVSVLANTKTQITQSLSLPIGNYIFFARTSIVNPTHFMTLCRENINNDVWIRVNSNEIIGFINNTAQQNFFVAILSTSAVTISNDSNLTSLHFIKLS